MSMIWRRKTTTTADPTQPQVVSSLSALTAASVTVPPQRWGKVTKPRGETKKWQEEIWDMLDLVGELSFSLLWKTALLSRFRLVASDLDPETGKPTGSTENAAARAVVRQIAGGATGQSQMLGRLAPLMMIPGEAWLAIIFPDGEEQWHVLSNDEVKPRGELVELELEDGTNYTMDPETDTLSRIWRQDPRRARLAWSPAKAALPILKEIVRMSQNIEAAGKSRQAGNGILVLPTEISMPAKPAPTGAPDPDAPNLPAPAPLSRFVTADEVRVALQEAMAKAIQDPSSAEALVPIILQVAGEWVDKIRHIKFDSEVSDKAQAAREKAVRRLAMTLDMPPEVLLGLADLNHWSLYGVEEEAVRWHAAPEMETICAALTTQLLRPMVPDADVVIWYDTSDVEAEPDQVEKVRTGFTDGVVRAEAYLRELGMSEEQDGYDLTTREGWTAWVLDQVRKDAALVPVLEPLLRTLVPALGLPELKPAPAAPPTPPPPAPELEQQRVPDTREQLAAAADTAVRICVNHAMKLAGNRRRTRPNHTQLQGIPPRDMHLKQHLGPCQPAEVDRLINGWDEVLDDEICATAGVSRDKLQALVASVCREALTTGTHPIWRSDR
ncbi:conjugal transfer protein TraF [Nocardia cerradoensis]|uniref:conjugal transfer protein TraF n=3 Tax=Nocardia cerradoensis TaxID=85688 RepID=UPI0014439D73|nr:conjugal transfer protein TraF [Nocardia cerradoensis]NKY48018.1 conjugal transfer protein TraF [Nocardia cerradoensis]